MSGYISEFGYYGNSSIEFIEVALPTGTGSGEHSIVIYDGSGNVQSTFPLGTSTGTMSQQDVYVVDQSTPGFSTGSSMGNLNPDSAIALVDGDGNVVQFVSYWDNTVTAQNGPAAGQTSDDVGSSGYGQSMETSDGGDTYQSQASPNSGRIPSCYAPGTLISTTDGPKAVEQIKPGDILHCARGGFSTVRWVWSGDQPLDDLDLQQMPVLIQKGALGDDIPSADLIVSGQHRMAVGLNGQLNDAFCAPYLVPAKALVDLPRIRFLAGQRSITWRHFVCDEHCVVFANGTASESMLLGPQVIKSLNHFQKRRLSAVMGQPVTAQSRFKMSLPCLSVGETKRLFIKDSHPIAA